MPYIIAGSNLSNREAPGAAFRADTAGDALQKVTELEASGYHVRVSNPDGDDVPVTNLKGLAASEASASQDSAPDPLSGSF